MSARNIYFDNASLSAEPLFQAELSGLNLLSRSNDKDVYNLGDLQLRVSSDHISVPEKNLVQVVKGKGHIVNQISAYWFRVLRKEFPNHLISTDPRYFPDICLAMREFLDGRSMLVWETTPIPIKCIVRGYLAGSAWQEYQELGKIGEIKLPGGMVESQRLPFPIFTPETVGMPGEAGEYLDFPALQSLLGKTMAESLRDASIKLYFSAWSRAREQGILIADTSFEFGLHCGKLMLIDECLTPDNSRFWLLDKYSPGAPMPSLGKQFLLDLLAAKHIDQYTHELPIGITYKIRERYLEAYKRIIGKSFFS